MWILARLIVAAGGFLFHYFALLKHTPPLQRLGSLGYSEEIKGRKVRTYRLGVPFENEIVFTMTPEKSWDMFFKTVGFSNEFQTGDAAFDHRVYIACDHPFFCKAIKESPRVRELILKLFDGTFYRLWSDGQRLYVESKVELDKNQWVPILHELHANLNQMVKNRPSRFYDMFVWRALLVESVLWSLASFAFVAYIESSIHREDYHLDWGRLIVYGLGLSAVVTCVLTGLIILFLQRSSRSHRILVECATLLTFSLPVFGVQAVSDLNRSLDSSPPETIEVQVLNRWQQEHRGRRGRRWFSYHMEVERKSGLIQLPRVIDISRNVYNSLSHRKTIPITIGQGRLGIPWYRSVNGIRYGGL